MSSDSPAQPPPVVRRHPAHGVFEFSDRPTIVYLTVCTKGRVPWLATAPNHDLLREIWSGATAWLVGRYVLMPDHLHLFAAPNAPDLDLDRWVRYWKSQFRQRHPDKSLRWQTDHWDTRLRRADGYEEKWRYVVNNPVRKGLVSGLEDWPFQGELFELRWA
jgi:putative transposase